tara:strand:- start:178 stop:630 length:453 start_codon:yes stop_codon:yes gene_type:complete
MTAFNKAWTVLKYRNPYNNPVQNTPDENIQDENTPDGNTPDGNTPDGNMGLDSEEGGPYMRTPSTRSALADIYGRKEGTIGGPNTSDLAPKFNPFHPTYQFNPLRGGDAGRLVGAYEIDPRIQGYAKPKSKLDQPRRPESSVDGAYWRVN